MACDDNVEESPEVTNAENPRSSKTPQSNHPVPMSNATETYRAWSAVMHDIASKHAETRAEAFVDSLNEYTELPADKRPIVTPSGVIIAETIALISILRAQVVTLKEQAITANEAKRVDYFNNIQKQTEIATLAIKHIEIF
jgi:hypothetical protein